MLLIPYRALLLHLKSIALASQKHSSCTSKALLLHLKSIALASQKHNSWTTKGMFQQVWSMPFMQTKKALHSAI
jgi:hypothetical protein